MENYLNTLKKLRGTPKSTQNNTFSSVAPSPVKPQQTQNPYQSQVSSSLSATTPDSEQDTTSQDTTSKNTSSQSNPQQEGLSESEVRQNLASSGYTENNNSPYLRYVTGKEDPMTEYVKSLSKNTRQSEQETDLSKKLADLNTSILSTGFEGRENQETLLDTPGMLRGGAQDASSQSGRRTSAELARLGVQQTGVANSLNALTGAREANTLASKPVQLGNDFYNPDTGELIYSTPKTTAEEFGTGNIGEYNFAKSQGYNGTFAQYQKEMANLKDVTSGGDSGLTPYQKFTATQSVAKDTQSRTQNAREMQRQAELINSSYQNIIDGGDRSLNTQAIVTSFNKILDPTSVVRESEFDRTAAGQSLISQLQGKVDNITKGGAGVTIETLKSAADIANKYLEGARKSIDDQNRRAKDMADSFGLNPDFVTTNYNEGNTPPVTPEEMSGTTPSGIKYSIIE